MAGSGPVQPKKFRSRKHVLPAVALAGNAGVESKLHPSEPVVTAWLSPFCTRDQSEFIPIRRGCGLYVDKTGHLHKLLASADGRGSQLQSKYVFLARPRRFGKTLLISTLEAFFQGDSAEVGKFRQSFL